MSEIDELYEALEEARDADQVASACVIYEEILIQEEVENVASTLLRSAIARLMNSTRLEVSSL